MESTPLLRLTYLGEQWVPDSSRAFLFGRGADNDINVERKADEQLHRRFGRIFYRNGVWWIANDGTELSLAVNDRLSRSSMTLAPGKIAALTFTDAAILFSGGLPNEYEIIIDLVDGPAEGASSPVQGGPRTTRYRPTERERLLLVVLGENKLRSPHRLLHVPPNNEVVRRLGLESKAYSSFLDRVCFKFFEMGAEGVYGQGVGQATDRRRYLVAYALEHSIITSDDLVVLEDYPTLD